MIAADKRLITKHIFAMELLCAKAEAHQPLSWDQRGMLLTCGAPGRSPVSKELHQRAQRAYKESIKRHENSRRV